MKLSDYMHGRGISDDAMAAKVGCSRPQMSRIRRGVCLPSLDLAVKLEIATGGLVRPSDFLPTHTEAA